MVEKTVKGIEIKGRAHWSKRDPKTFTTRYRQPLSRVPIGKNGERIIFKIDKIFNGNKKIKIPIEKSHSSGTESEYEDFINPFFMEVKINDLGP